jgi:hypothetical protein
MRDEPPVNKQSRAFVAVFSSDGMPILAKYGVVYSCDYGTLGCDLLLDVCVALMWRYGRRG